MSKIKNCVSEVLCMMILTCFLSFNVNVSADTSKWLYDESGKVVCLYKIENNEVTITSCGNIDDIIILPEIEGFPVTKLSHNAAAMNSFYTSITLPETLVTIEDEAIISCENIKEITIPKSVKSIGKCALGYIYKLYPSQYQDYIVVIEKMDNFMINGYKGTAAETYAKNNGFTFIALDDGPDVTITTTTQTTTTSTTVSATVSTETTKATTATSITSSTITTSVSSTTVTTTSTSVTTSISTTSTTTTPDITTNIIGDANEDNKLDVRDAAFIAQKIARNKISELPKCADYNQDGVVNVRDAAAIARDLAQNNT